MIYHHGHILVLAKRAYERSLEEHSESFVSITLSAMALECYINDFTHQSSQDILSINVKPLKDLSYVLATLEDLKFSLISKIEMIHYLLSDEQMDRGARKHQDLTMLIRLRNELVHRKPEDTGLFGIEGIETEPHKYVRFFSNRGIIEKPSSDAPPTWSQYLNNPDVAKWAFNTVVTTINDIVAILPRSHFAHIQAMMTDDYEEI